VDGRVFLEDLRARLGERLGWLRARLRELLARRRVRLGLGVVLACGFGLLLLFGAAWRTCAFGRCPDVARLTAYRPERASLLLDRNGRLISQLVPADHDMVELRLLPAHVPAAFVAIEDRRFFAHGAVDLRRVVGALRANLRSHAFEQGFSTLSMQLARNLFPEEIPGSRRTTMRKLLEIRVAQEIENRFSKPEILELYLNHIYFGNGARGIESAAQQYFRCPAARLSVAQAALLAALPKAPTRYDPRLHPERALARRNLVLARMVEQQRLPPAQATAAEQEPLGVRPQLASIPSATGFARYFAEEVRRELEERFGEQLYERPLRIWTTLDVDAQHAAEQELARQLQAIETGKLGRFASLPAAGAPAAQARLEGAVVALAADSGDVLAWVGGRDFGWSRFDRVIHARRQAGSAWKPFVYAAALENGYALSQPLEDTPLAVPLSGGEVWRPRNYDNSFAGPISLREALVRSRNVPAVRLALAVGLSRVAEMARRTGISEDAPLLPSMPLGTLAVSPLELTRAYTAFAALGQEAEARLVLRVETAAGEPLWTAPPPQRRAVLTPEVAFLLDDALRDALERGSGAPGRRAVFERAAAGKTGTSTGGDDVWFIGYTPEVVAGVWIGFDQPRPVASQATGGRLAAPVWGRLMSRIYAHRAPPQPWPVPAGIVVRPIDPATGLVLAPGCEQREQRESRDGREEREALGAGDPGEAGGEREAGEAREVRENGRASEAAAAPTEYFIAGREPAATCPGRGQNPPRNAFFTEREGAGREADDASPLSRAAADTGAPAGAEAERSPGTIVIRPSEADAEAQAAAQALQAAREAAPAQPDRGVAGRTDTQVAAPPEPPSGATEERGAAATPRDEARGAEAPAPAEIDLSGRWEVTNTVEETSDPAGSGTRITYRINLHQEGARITGEGERWTEAAGGSEAPEPRTTLHLTGLLTGRQARLQFVEQGGDRLSGGTFRWSLPASGERLTGSFTGGAGSRGASQAVRIQ
jgi:penicillin-binding protein 1A